MIKRPAAAGLLTGLALVAIPIAAFAASEPAAKGDDYYKKKICETIKPIGSRLGGTRRCRTQAESTRPGARTARCCERVQAFKPQVCMPPNPC